MSVPSLFAVISRYTTSADNLYNCHVNTYVTYTPSVKVAKFTHNGFLPSYIMHLKTKRPTQTFQDFHLWNARIGLNSLGSARIELSKFIYANPSYSGFLRNIRDSTI